MEDSSGAEKEMPRSRPGSGSAYKTTFDTYKFVTGNKMLRGANKPASPVPLFNPGQGSSLDQSLDNSLASSNRFPHEDETAADYPFESYTVSRDGSYSPSPLLVGGAGTSTFNTITQSERRLSAFPHGPHQDDGDDSVMQVRTVGELRVPDAENVDALASPLGSVPSLDKAGTGGLGSVPGPLMGSLGSFTCHFGSNSGPMGSFLGGAVTSMAASSGGLGLGSVPSLGSLPLGSVPEQRGLMAGIGDAPPGSLTIQPGDPQLGDRKDDENRADGMSDMGEPDDVDAGEFVGGSLMTANALSSGEASEIEQALQRLTPEEMERRRKKLGMGKTYR